MYYCTDHYCIETIIRTTNHQWVVILVIPIYWAIPITILEKHPEELQVKALPLLTVQLQGLPALFNAQTPNNPPQKTILMPA